MMQFILAEFKISLLYQPVPSQENCSKHCSARQPPVRNMHITEQVGEKASAWP